MVKFNKQEVSMSEMGDHTMINDEIDWKQFLVDYQHQSPAEAIRNIVAKLMTKEGIEFDQMCLILKHYLLIDTENENSYLNHFLQFEQSSYVVQFVERFNKFNALNEQWMISEIFKLLSSLCSVQQANHLINSSQFREYLLSSAFDASILAKLRVKSGLKLTEVAILTNMFETISNLCEIKNELINAITASHIEWLTNALAHIDHSNKDLIVSLARLFHMISEYLLKSSNVSLSNVLLDFYMNRNFFADCIANLAKSPTDSDGSNSNGNQATLTTNEDILTNLNARLYIIASFANLILSNEKLEVETNVRKSRYLLNVLREYSDLVVYALNINLEEKSLNSGNNKLNGETENSDDEDKTFFKTFEKAIEAKLVSIDLISSISEYFIKDNESQCEEEDYESWEDCESESEATDSNNNKTEMDIEMDHPNQTTQHSTIKCLDDSEISEFKNLLQSHKLMSLLAKTICNDDENSFQETEKIAHICSSIKLIRTEAAKAYSLLVENFYFSDTQNGSVLAEAKSDIELSHLISLLNLLATRPIECFLDDGSQGETNGDSKNGGGGEDETETLLEKLLDLIFDLFTYFNELSVAEFTLTQRMAIVELIKQILFKYKVDLPELCIQMARIVGLMAIRLRNNNIIEGKPIIYTCANILIELTNASFQQSDQSQITTLRLNAELMDLLIDLFGEDNLTELENSLGFIERIKWFSERFYAKYKQLGKKQKMFKEHSAILKTVKDNFKSFVDYKIQNSK